MATTKRFGMIPAAITDHPDLGLGEIGVLAAMSTFADREGRCRVSQSMIATQLKMSRPWVIKVINTLVSLGLVERAAVFDRNGGQRANAYRLRFDLLPSETHPNSVAPEPSACPSGDRGCHGGDPI